jgi:ABC-type transport system substrate-binding protein
VLCLSVAPEASAAADPNKVAHIVINAGETGFDPAKVTDLVSNEVNEAIFERLLTYDYLARPAKLVPMLAEAMPEITDNGRTYTFRLRKGVYFAPDSAFKGQKRELTAEDVVYSYKRFLDPKVRSPWALFLTDKIEGLDEVAAAAKRSGQFDYSRTVTGLQALDRYTVRFRLKRTDYTFLYIAAHIPMGIVAREVMETYADDTMAHPVGTGPYILKQWQRASKIVLEANPDYRGFIWDFAASDPAWDDPLIKDMRGKRMPQIGRVEISVIEEPLSRYLAFEQGQLDYINLPQPLRDRALTADDKLVPGLSAKGIQLYRAVDPDFTYTTFNFRDPSIGGFTKEKIALRRAIIMAYDSDSEIKVVRKNLAVKAEMPIPPGVVGHDPAYKSINQYDPDLANKLLDHYGYKIGSDGWRTLPDGKPLVLHLATETSSDYREFDEVWQRSLNRIHVKALFDASKFADNVKAGRACKLMMWGQSWIADYPDGEDFLQLAYGPTIGENNYSCYASKAFDAFYDKARLIPDSPERNRLYLEMTRQLEVDGVWQFGVSRLRNELIWPWVKGFKKHPILQAEFLYMDIDRRSK